ncbi:MAG: ribosome silencing factor [candidate division WOR-3 bacterium]
MTSERLARRAAELIYDRQGDDIVIMDLRCHSPLADYFVLATAGSAVHGRAIAEELQERLKREGEPVHHVEGEENGTWVLLDYFTVVVHILLGEVRQFYGLERLWGDAPQRPFPENPDVNRRTGRMRA